MILWHDSHPVPRVANLAARGGLRYSHLEAVETARRESERAPFLPLPEPVPETQPWQTAAAWAGIAISAAVFGVIAYAWWIW